MLESRAARLPRSEVNADAALVWFRRDLRDYDHAALYHALKTHGVYCAFCFDTEILDALPSPADRRVEFTWRSVEELDHSRGGGMIVVQAALRRYVPELARVADRHIHTRAVGDAVGRSGGGRVRDRTRLSRRSWITAGRGESP